MKTQMSSTNSRTNLPPPSNNQNEQIQTNNIINNIQQTSNINNNINDQYNTIQTNQNITDTNINNNESNINDSIINNRSSPTSNNQNELIQINNININNNQQTSNMNNNVNSQHNTILTNNNITEININNNNTENNNSIINNENNQEEQQTNTQQALSFLLEYGTTESSQSSDNKIAITYNIQQQINQIPSENITLNITSDFLLESPQGQQITPLPLETTKSSEINQEIIDNIFGKDSSEESFGDYEDIFEEENIKKRKVNTRSAAQARKLKRKVSDIRDTTGASQIFETNDEMFIDEEESEKINETNRNIYASSRHKTQTLSTPINKLQEIKDKKSNTYDITRNKRQLAPIFSIENLPPTSKIRKIR